MNKIDKLVIKWGTRIVLFLLTLLVGVQIGLHKGRQLEREEIEIEYNLKK
ncbi:MAG: hypothetical protein AB1297_03135 [bacterium]